MRIAPAHLLVLLAVLLPFIVQIRTVAGFLGLEVTVAQNAAIGALIILAVILWAMMPEDGSNARTPNGGGQ